MSPCINRRQRRLTWVTTPWQRCQYNRGVAGSDGMGSARTIPWASALLLFGSQKSTGFTLPLAGALPHHLIFIRSLTCACVCSLPMLGLLAGMLFAFLIWIQACGDSLVYQQWRMALDRGIRRIGLDNDNHGTWYFFRVGLNWGIWCIRLETSESASPALSVCFFFRFISICSTIWFFFFIDYMKERMATFPSHTSSRMSTNVELETTNWWSGLL